jgi:propanol-preferring alcohol dehydrogenase
MREVLAMAAEGKIHCEVASRPLAQVNEVLEQVREGKVRGRLVLVPR